MDANSYVVDLRREGFSSALLSVLGEERKKEKKADDLLWENMLNELNKELHSRTSLEGKLFLVGEDDRQWLLYVSKEDEKEFFEFISKVILKEEDFCSHKGIVRRLSDRWHACFNSYIWTQRVWVEVVASRGFIEKGLERDRLTLVVTQYFTDRGFSASWGRCQDYCDYLKT